MAHHMGPDGEKLSRGMAELFDRQDRTNDIESMMETLRIGATGRYPEGVLTEEDEGELRIGITATGGKVVLAFGKAVDWIGFGPEQVREIAQTLLDRAAECDGIGAKVRRERE